MKTRKRALTAQIKPETRHAIMDQLALAAEQIIWQRESLAMWQVWQKESEARHVQLAKRREKRSFWLGVWMIAAGVTGIAWLVTL